MFEELPLFPLNNMLFPGGVLPLRIFEKRYLKMVGDCMRQDKPFVVVLIKQGNEVGDVTEFHHIGTVCKIEDFDQLEDGLLGISCRGYNLVRVVDYDVQDDGLVVGSIQHLPEQASVPVTAEYEPMANFLRSILARDEVRAYRNGLIEDWGNLNWLSYRIAELLPLPQDRKQLLLEMEPIPRIHQLQSMMLENKLLRSS